MASISMYEVLRFGYKNEMWPKKTFIWVHNLNWTSTHSLTHLLFCGFWWENFGNRHNLFIVTTKHGCTIGRRPQQSTGNTIYKKFFSFPLCSFSSITPKRWCCFCWTSIKSNFRFLLPKMLCFSITLSKQMKCKHI